eukprot:TRINITY_DN63893_c0_g1_i1.p1 TRINITY_DN63893_c0_g1~~TRINITY_DN63893_c0_g1_i1.p1  ORF type:complete len:207 (-),score=49.39 TRINITY_DN63893_c0_g1_i1:180-707(-)
MASFQVFLVSFVLFFTGEASRPGHDLLSAAAKVRKARAARAGGADVAAVPEVVGPMKDCEGPCGGNSEVGSTVSEEESRCICDATADMQCVCTGSCTDDQQKRICTEIIGPCQCERNEEAALCECSGHCHTSEDRADACVEASGCEWKGHWCEASRGIMWEVADEDSDALSDEEM